MIKINIFNSNRFKESKSFFDDLNIEGPKSPFGYKCIKSDIELIQDPKYMSDKQTFNTEVSDNYKKRLFMYPEENKSGVEIIEYINDIIYELLFKQMDSYRLNMEINFYTNSEIFITQFRVLIKEEKIKKDNLELIFLEKDNIEIINLCDDGRFNGNPPKAWFGTYEEQLFKMIGG